MHQVVLSVPLPRFESLLVLGNLYINLLPGNFQDPVKGFESTIKQIQLWVALFRLMKDYLRIY